MVYYSELSENELYSIIIGLSNWEKHPLEFEHALSYYDDIRKVCDRLDKISFHADSQYETHKLYGKKTFQYKRNNQTTWYIIYDIDIATNTIYVQHITSNHLTER